jgi:hypothetical protein
VIEFTPGVLGVARAANSGHSGPGAGGGGGTVGSVGVGWGSGAGGGGGIGSTGEGDGEGGSGMGVGGDVMPPPCPSDRRTNDGWARSARAQRASSWESGMTHARRS